MGHILVTGGLGYVGCVLVDRLLKLGYKINILDLGIYGKNFFKKNKNLSIFIGDIRDKELIKQSVSGCNTVIHLACISNDPSFDLNPNLGKSINYDAFRPLVEISKKSEIKKFIYASSSSVYGIKKEKNVNEKTKLEPLTDYSKYKADCEKILFEYQSDTFTTTVLRPATVCGYSPRQRFDLVVNILTNLAYNKKEITVFGGEQLRPNIHIKDMVEAYVHILNMPKNKIAGEIFNVGFQNMKVIDLANLVREIIGDEVKIIIKSTNDNRSYHISSKKIENILKFKPQFSIKDAVIDLNHAFKKNLFSDTLNNELYFNIKKMNSIKLS